jgi:hypothetical protein
MTRYLSVLFVACGLHFAANAQENSPYSRYGLGDVVPNHNIFSRAMGGISAGALDYQSINFTNPASLAGISNTIFDIAAEADVRTLRSSVPPQKFTSANSLFSYLQLGVPLTTKKMYKKDKSWGVSFGIRPVTRIGYKIEKHERLAGIDSLNTLYEGTGGVYQAFIGTGYRVRNLYFGISGGYMFGSKDYSTKLEFINDSVIYYKANYQTKTTFSGIFMNLGIQYETKLKNDGILRFGAYGSLQQKLKASRDEIKETFAYDGNGGTFRVDSVYENDGIKGNIKYPSTVGLGFTYIGKHWMYGLDVETANWSNYTYYGQTDQVKNNFTVRIGTQYYPAKPSTMAKKYFNFVKYRAGFYYGSDYINVNKNRPEFGFTVGTGMPLTSLQRISYNGEYVVLNTAVEIGSRGNKQTNLRESTTRYSIGISMNARWFQKPKYN